MDGYEQRVEVQMVNFYRSLSEKDRRRYLIRCSLPLVVRSIGLFRRRALLAWSLMTQARRCSPDAGDVASFCPVIQRLLGLAGANSAPTA
jgi:hypothetical protein